MPDLMRPTHLYRHFDHNGVLLYVGISVSFLARLKSHESSSHWANNIFTVTREWHPTRLSAVSAEAKAIREEKPLHNTVGVPVSASRSVLRRSGLTKERFIQLLDELGLSAAEIAQLCECNISTVHRWIKGKTRIPQEVALLLLGLRDQAFSSTWLSAALKETARHV